MPAEFIYTTYKLARHYPPDRTVLEDISISFYPGAKIGVIGPNGAGKSSLLRIMAGLDDGFTGEARLTPGFTVGYLSQEPQLDPAKDVKGNVMDGVREVQALLDQYNAVMAKWSDPDADYEAIGAEQSRARGPDQRRRRLERRAQRRHRDGGAALPAGRRRRRRRCPAARSGASRWPGSCSSTRTCCSSTSRPTTSTPSRSSGSSGSSTSTPARSSPSPTTATSSTTSRSGSSSSTGAGASRSPATTRAGSSRSSSASAREQKQVDARQRTLARELEWVRMGAKARQAKGKARLSAYEKLLAEANDARDTTPRARDRDPAGPAPRRPGHRGAGPPQGLRRPAADRGPDVLAAAGRDRRDHRPERRRQDDAVPDARRPGAAGRRDRSRSATRSS